MRNAITKRPQPRLARAREWLAQHASVPDTSPRLSVSELARECGVSRMTMWKAMHTHTQTAPSRRDDILQALLDDINKGTFQRGSHLPVLKSLAERYGTSYSTLTDVLVELSRRGILVRRKRGYNVFSTDRGVARKATVLCISANSDASRFQRSTPRSAEFWRTIERECHRREINFETRTVWEIEETALRRSDTTCSLRQLVRDYRILGVIYWVLGSDKAGVQSVVSALLPLGLPVSVLVESHLELLEPVLPAARRNPLLRLFTMGLGPLCGTTVGRFLASSGHRKAAFFGVAAGEVRAAGVREAMIEAGHADPLLYLAPPQFAADSEFEDTIERTEPYKSMARALSEYIHSLGPTLTAAMQVFLPDSWSTRMAFMRDMMRPLFAQALTHADISAWVGLNDRMAFLALDFLEEHRVAVPQKVSVVGFDDMVEAFDRGLSTYSFNAPACAVAVLDHLLAPERLRALHPGPLIEIPGSVIVRRTTR